MSRTLHNLILTTLLILPPLPRAFAAAQTTNIVQSDFLIGGSLQFTENWTAGNSTTGFLISAPFQYFVIDRLALGVNFSLSYQDAAISRTTLGVGPVGTYYFLLQDRLGYYFSQDFKYDSDAFGGLIQGSSYDYTMDSTLGVNYFFTPATAFGPGIVFTHLFGNNGASDQNQLALLIRFSIYL